MLLSIVKTASVACTTDILLSQMMPLEYSVSDATIWSITMEVSITILEASFTLIFDVHSIDVI